MDVMFLFQQIGAFFIRLCATSFSVGGYTFTVGSVYIFCSAVIFITWFVRKLTD